MRSVPLERSVLTTSLLFWVHYYQAPGKVPAVQRLGVPRQRGQGHQAGFQPISFPLGGTGLGTGRRHWLCCCHWYSVGALWHLIYTACVAVSTRTCSSALASRMLFTGSRPITGKGHKQEESGLRGGAVGISVALHPSPCPTGIGRLLTLNPASTQASMPLCCSLLLDSTLRTLMSSGSLVSPNPAPRTPPPQGREREH